MIPMLRIQLLGNFLLRSDDTPVTTVDSPRLQALLAYFLLHRDAPHPRQHLAFLLWPDTTEAQAHTNLRTLLHRLRRAQPEADHFLHVDAQTLHWRADAPWTLDVVDFERAVAQADQAERAAKRPNFAYLPFGGGPRQCIGNTFALTEATLILATVAQRYRLRLVPGHPVSPKSVFVLKTSHGLPMTLHPR